MRPLGGCFPESPHRRDNSDVPPPGRAAREHSPSVVVPAASARRCENLDSPVCVLRRNVATMSEETPFDGVIAGALGIYAASTNATAQSQHARSEKP
jgi:hypothetical protein